MHYVIIMYDHFKYLRTCVVLTIAPDDLTEDDYRIKGEIFIVQANIPAIMDELEKILALEVDAKGQVIVKLAGKINRN